MMVLLPILALALAVININSRRDPGRSEAAPIRASLLIAISLWGAYLALATEALSLINAIEGRVLWAVWGLPVVALSLFLYRRWSALRQSGAGLVLDFLSSWDGLNLILLSAASLVLAVIALRSPPNNFDSLLYHMSRVAHWAQNRSLAHYPTGYELQLFFPPWAEIAILHLRLLWGDDLLAGMVQWGSMIVSLAGVSAIAAELRGSRSAQIVSAALAFSIPMGLLQSTSTQNDYVVAMWLTALALFTLRGVKSPLCRQEWVAVGCALGLGMLTKGTFYVYGLPFLIWLAVVELRRARVGAMLMRYSAVGAIVLVLNAGFFVRNLVTYSSPLGPSELQSELVSPSLSPGSILGSIMKESAIHFATPSEAANERLEVGMNRVLGALGADGPQFSVNWFWNHEDFATSPMHMGAALLAPPVLVWSIARSRRMTVRTIYAVVVLSSFLLFAIVLKWQYFNVRLHLPFFVAWSPAVGLALASIMPRWGVRAASTALLALSVPWILLNNTRPLIGLKPRTSIDGIFAAPRTDILLANSLSLREPYSRASQAILGSSCREIGLRIDSHDPEYAFWYLLDEPQGPRRLETVYTFPHLERYRDPEFEPCLVLCTICEPGRTLPGFERWQDFGHVTLYRSAE